MDTFFDETEVDFVALKKVKFRKSRNPNYA